MNQSTDVKIFFIWHGWLHIKSTNIETGKQNSLAIRGVTSVLLHETILSEIMTLEMLSEGSSVLPWKRLTVENKPKIFTLLGSISDPLCFFKVLSPNNSKARLGQSHEKYLRWWPGVGVGSISHKPLLCLSGVTAGKSWLHFLSPVQKERPQEWPVASRPWQGHTNRAVFLPGWVESLLRDCSACKAPRGREGGEYQKIVVSYLVFIPRLASCPGSTIHGRLARVFCSDGSICFRTERLMPVIRYLLRSARMPGNHCTLARLQDAGGWAICWFFWSRLLHRNRVQGTGSGRGMVIEAWPLLLKAHRWGADIGTLYWEVRFEREEGTLRAPRKATDPMLGGRGTSWRRWTWLCPTQLSNLHWFSSESE